LCRDHPVSGILLQSCPFEHMLTPIIAEDAYTPGSL
jgi:hypothetical protein